MNTVNEFNPTAQLMELSELSLQVLDLQRKYFTTRKKEILQKCIAKEHELRLLANKCLENLNENSDQQTQLF